LRMGGLVYIHDITIIIGGVMVSRPL
jgi:hypothetical protein